MKNLSKNPFTTSGWVKDSTPRKLDLQHGEFTFFTKWHKIYVVGKYDSSTYSVQISRRKLLSAEQLKDRLIRKGCRFKINGKLNPFMTNDLRVLWVMRSNEPTLDIQSYEVKQIQPDIYVGNFVNSFYWLEASSPKTIGLEIDWVALLGCVIHY